MKRDPVITITWYIYNVVKVLLSKFELKLSNYRDFKSFSSEAFKEDLSEALINCGDSHNEIDNKHVPKKKKMS